MIYAAQVALLAAIWSFWVFRRGRDRGVLLRGLLWLAYAVYEYLMFKRVLCSGECNIRVDLLLIYPILFGVSFWLSVAAARKAARASPVRK